MRMTAQGRRRQTTERARSDACRRPQAAGRAGDAGLARAAAAVGVEVPREAGRALKEMGHRISANTVGKLLTDALGFSRQVNRKADEGSHHPDRNAQFEHINAKVVAAQAKGEPVISVDTKKKELVGNFKNAGSDYRPQGHRPVNVHDFADKELGKAV